MKKLILVMIIICLLIGCSSTRKIYDPETDVTVIDYGANRRGTYLLKETDGQRVIVSEPSPDVAKEITGSLGLSAKTLGEIADPNLKAEYASKVVDLANRSQTLQVLREALFRLSEMGASSDITDDKRIELYIKVLETVRIIAVTELANSKAPEEFKNEWLKKWTKDIGTQTVE